MTRSFTTFSLIALLLGITIGVLTLVLQGVLLGDLNQAANSAAVWVIVAYFVGWRSSSWQQAIAAALLAVVGEVLGYYGFAYLRDLMDINIYTMAVVGVWLGLALIAGPLFGGAGYIAMHGIGVRQKVALGALSAIFIGEGLYWMTILPTFTASLLWWAVAIVITLSLTWNYAQRIQVWVITMGLGLLFFAGQYFLGLIDQWRAGNFMI